MIDSRHERGALEALIGRVLHERYRIDALLGMGGMGGVFKARHLGLGQDVAVKVLHPTLARTSVARARFEREARSASRLDHPNCVRVTDFGTLGDGTSYLVMQLLEGEPLGRRLGVRWEPPQAVELATQILEGLAHAHHRNVIHRDLKPENVILTTDERGHRRVKIVDFGIAKVLDDDGADARLTRTGMLLGTPRYMSPEQAGGGKVDARTDLYAVGLLLYEMLAGSPPFVGGDVATMMRMHILATPPSLPSDIAPSLSAIVMRLLAKTRKARPAGAENVIAMLAEARTSMSGTSVVASESTRAGPSGIGPVSVAPTQPDHWPTATAYGPRSDHPRRTHAKPLLWGGGAVFAALWLGVGAYAYWHESTPRSSPPGPSFMTPGQAPDSSPASPSTSDGGDPSSDDPPLRVCQGESCRCRGSDACDLECLADCELECPGSGDCTFVCANDCVVHCDGPGNCVMDVGDGSVVTCRGPGDCEVTCRGACELDCHGRGDCDLRCLDERAPGPTTCGGGSLSCGACS